MTYTDWVIIILAILLLFQALVNRTIFYRLRQLERSTGETPSC